MGLEYDAVYAMHCKLTLRTGHRVTLDSLLQWHTYAGLIEGTPIARTNDWIVEGAVRRAKQCLHADAHLVAPHRRAERHPVGQASEPGRGEHDVQWLPAVACAARFSDGGSFLVVVWFQDDLAPPILEPALG